MAFLPTFPRPDTLVAWMKNATDFNRARTEGWYRIPASTKRQPFDLYQHPPRWVAFYLPAHFSVARRNRISHYAELLDVRPAKRRELLPHEPANAKSDQCYHRIALGPLRELPRPIIKARLQRSILPFISTTWTKLVEAEEINDIFHDSLLEDTLWAACKSAGLRPERQWLESTGERNWVLDFVFTCRDGNVNVECDGDTYHLSTRDQVRYDKGRNNALTAKNWDVLRYDTRQLTRELPLVMEQIQEKIYRRRGLVLPDGTTRYVPLPDRPPELFDGEALYAAGRSEDSLNHSAPFSHL